jgi:hypothetical protein
MNSTPELDGAICLPIPANYSYIFYINLNPFMTIKGLNKNDQVLILMD